MALLIPVGRKAVNKLPDDIDSLIYLPLVQVDLNTVTKLWKEVGYGSAFQGGISDNEGSSSVPSMAIAPDDTPYVAWADDSSGRDQIYVRRWNGTEWEEIGAGSASEGGVSDIGGLSYTPSIAVDPEGTPYVTWYSDVSPGDYNIYVRRWNGSEWEEVGTGSATPGEGGISDTSVFSRDPEIAIAPDGTPYIAWEDGQIGTKHIYVRRWNGDTWEEVGEDSASAAGISGDVHSFNPAIAIDPDGIPYIAWITGDLVDYNLYLRRWNGSDWEEVGAGSASGDGVSSIQTEMTHPALAIAPDGTPYVSWGDTVSGNHRIFVSRWDGSTWEEVGTDSVNGGLIETGDSRYQTLAIAMDSTPYLSWVYSSDNDPGATDIYAMRWSGSAWEEVCFGSASGGGISRDGQSRSPSIAIGLDSNPYIAWSNGEIYVRHYVGD